MLWESVVYCCAFVTMWVFVFCQQWQSDPVLTASYIFIRTSQHNSTVYHMRIHTRQPKAMRTDTSAHCGAHTTTNPQTNSKDCLPVPALSTHFAFLHSTARLADCWLHGFDISPWPPRVFMYLCVFCSQVVFPGMHRNILSFLLFELTPGVA